MNRILRLARNTHRRGYMLIIILVTLPLILIAVFGVLGNVERRVIETNHIESRTQARLLAESALSVLRSTPNGGMIAGRIGKGKYAVVPGEGGTLLAKGIVLNPGVRGERTVCEITVAAPGSSEPLKVLSMRTTVEPLPLILLKGCAERPADPRFISVDEFGRRLFQGDGSNVLRLPDQMTSAPAGNVYQYVDGKGLTLLAWTSDEPPAGMVWCYAADGTTVSVPLLIKERLEQVAKGDDVGKFGMHYFGVFPAKGQSLYAEQTSSTVEVVTPWGIAVMPEPTDGSKWGVDEDGLPVQIPMTPVEIEAAKKSKMPVPPPLPPLPTPAPEGQKLVPDLNGMPVPVVQDWPTTAVPPPVLPQDFIWRPELDLAASGAGVGEMGLPMMPGQMLRETGWAPLEPGAVLPADSRVALRAFNQKTNKNATWTTSTVRPLKEHPWIDVKPYGLLMDISTTQPVSSFPVSPFLFNGAP